jgi:hypothetical protein
MTNKVTLTQNMPSRIWEERRVIELFIHLTMPLERGEIKKPKHFNWQVKSKLWKYYFHCEQKLCTVITSRCLNFCKIQYSYSLFSKNPESRTIFVTPLGMIGFQQWYFVSHQTKEYPGDYRFSPVQYWCSICTHLNTFLICMPSILSVEIKINYFAVETRT